MSKILLLDYDYTLYPSTLTTLKAVDERINLYIQTFLGYSPEAADAARLQLWEKYGTTLKGLEEQHGMDRHHYCDFIHAIEDHHLPPVDTALTAWLGRIPHPIYIFTNARMDWVVRGLKSMGLESILPGSENQLGGTKLQGIFDIAFMDWQGKPHQESYVKVEAFLRNRHGQNVEIHFADDRLDNLRTAEHCNWTTIWIPPHNAPSLTSGLLGQTAATLTAVDPSLLGSAPVHPASLA